MIDHAWLQVSYMAQIIVACLLFMIPVAKRRRSPHDSLHAPLFC